MVTWLIEWLADRWLLYYCSGSLTSLWCFAWFARWLAHLIHACLAPAFDSSTSRPWFAWLPRSQVYVIRAFKTILKHYFTVGWLVGWLAGWLVTLLVGWVLDLLVGWIALMVCLIRSIERQKLNQVAAELPPGWVFGVQLGFACVLTYFCWFALPCLLCVRCLVCVLCFALLCLELPSAWVFCVQLGTWLVTWVALHSLFNHEIFELQRIPL